MLKYILPFLVFLFATNVVMCQSNRDKGSPDNNASKKIALVIGNADYNSVGKLKNTINDAKAVAAELEKVGFEVILGLNLTHKEMITSIYNFIEKLKKASPGVGLFYFGGHGIQSKGENYLIPTNACIEKEQDIEMETYNLARIIGEMEYANENLNLIILDACRNNKLQQLENGTKNKGLAIILPPMYTYIIYAAKPGFVSEDGDMDYGIYATAMIKYLSIPNQSFVDFLKKVRKSIYEETNKAQIPWDTGAISFEFYFNKVD